MKKLPCLCTLFLLLWPVTDFARMHTFTGTLVDTNAQPIANAIVYVEVFKNGTYDFVWTVSGKNGEIPGQGYPPLRVNVKRGSGYAYCVFTETMLPAVMNNHRSVTKKSGIDIVISDKHLHALRLVYNPDLFHLDFPFENCPALRERLKHEKNAPLIAVFRKAYEDAKSDSEGISTEAVKKNELLNTIK